MSQQKSTRPEAAEGQKLRIALLFGGLSSEHAVSCVSATSVLHALDPDRFEVLPIGITPRGTWRLVPREEMAFAFEEGKPLPEVQESEASVRFSKESGTPELWEYAGGTYRSLGPVDVVFPILHGPFGEDGTVQGVLELVGLPYAGAGVLASAVGMDKEFMKRLFASAGFQVGPYAVIKDKAWRADENAAIESTRELKFPLFVKPARAGSSQGITRVEGPEGLKEAIETAREHDLKVIIEQGLEGREIEVAVLEGRGTDPSRASLPGEIVVEESGTHDFYDFTAKYIEGDAALLSCPADLPAEVIEKVRALAIKAFDALDGEGLSRVDFFYTPEGELVINEINTMPGFTSSSMYPAMWNQTGLSYPELVNELVSLALNRPIGLR